MLEDSDRATIRRIFQEELGYLGRGLQKDMDKALAKLDKIESQLKTIKANL